MNEPARIAVTLGSEIQRLRGERGWSQPQLAAKTFTSRALVSHWEAGRRRITPTQVRTLDDVLGAGGLLIEIAAGASGLTYDPAWDESLRKITAMWQHDASRRTLIRTAAYSAAALAAPLTQWIEHTAARPASGGTRRIGTPEIETIRTVGDAFRSLDNRFGGLTSRDGVVSFLDAEVTPLLREGALDGEPGRRLLAAAAEMTHLAGWMSYDSAMHGAAERYFVQALRLAEAAADTRLGIEILSAMSHQAAFLGHGAEAVQLGETAMRAAADAGAPVLVAEAAVMAAHGYAVSGDRVECGRLLLEAEQTLDRADRADDPRWVSYMGEAYLAAKRGHCLLAVGDVHGAIDAARRSLDMDGAAYVRGQMFNLSLLATSLAAAGDPDEAVAHGQAALDLTEGMRSARAGDYLQRLTVQLSDYDTAAAVGFSAAVAAAV